MLFRGLAEWRVWLPLTVTEAWNIGLGSLPIVLLVAGFAGAVTALQTGISSPAVSRTTSRGR